MFRRNAKIQMLSNSAKHLEAEVFQVGHEVIIHGNCWASCSNVWPAGRFSPDAFQRLTYRINLLEVTDYDLGTEILQCL